MTVIKKKKKRVEWEEELAATKNHLSVNDRTDSFLG